MRVKIAILVLTPFEVATLLVLMIFDVTAIVMDKDLHLNVTAVRYGDLNDCEKLHFLLYNYNLPI